MPALIDQPQVLRVRIGWIVAADLTVGTTLHFSYTGTAPSDATCATIAAAIRAQAVTDFVPMISPDVELGDVTVTDLTSSTSGTGEATGTTDGSRSGAALPGATCLLASYSIARRYRGGKPRSYWPWGTSDDTDGGQQWTTGFTTGAATALNSFLSYVSDYASSGTSITGQVNVSYYDGFVVVTNPITGRTRNAPKPRTVAIPPDPVLGVAINPRYGSQRRRNQTV